jgi:WD40 repeat protein
MTWLCLIAFGALAATQETVDWSSLVSKVSPAVVTIVSADERDIAQGSGVLISSDGKIVTNFHVVEGKRVMLARRHDGSFLTITGVLAADKANDLVILKADGRNLPFVPLGDSDAVKVGEAICVIGSPMLLEGTVTTGIISAIRELKDGRKLLQISAPISKGSSGSPVFNRKGEVIGIASFQLAEGQNLNFAVSVNMLKELLRRVKEEPEPLTKLSSFSTSPIRELPKLSPILLRLWIAHEIFVFRASVFSIAFSPDGQFLVSGGEDDNIKLWRLADGSLVRKLKGHSDSVLSLAFSPRGQLLASGSADRTIRLWQVADGRLILRLKGHTGKVRDVAFSPDGQLLASGSDDKTVRIWQVADGGLLKTLTGHISGVNSVAFSPDGQVLASGSSDKVIRLWRTPNGDLLQTLMGHTDRVTAVAFSPDGQLLASGSADRTIRLWRISDGSLVRILIGHADRVNFVVFSPDGRLLASGSGDDTVILWRVVDRQILWILPHTNQVFSIAFSPNGQLLAVGDDDGQVNLWRLW